jgi:phage/plasmid-associated DNA primase
VFYFRGRQIYGANDLPDTEDISDGFMRRPIVIRLEEQFSEYPDKKDPHQHRRDPDLRDDVTTPEELGNLLYYLVGRLRKIIRLGYIPDLPTTEETKEEWENETSHIPEFLDSECVVQADVVVTTARLYAAYATFCQKRAWAPVSDRKFPSKLTRLRPKILHDRINFGKKQARGFKGLSLLTDRTLNLTIPGTLENSVKDVPIYPSDPSANPCFEGAFSNQNWADCSEFFKAGLRRTD